MQSHFYCSKTQQNLLGFLKGAKKHLLTAVLLLMACFTAWATDYVFVYNGGYLAAGNNNTVTYVTTFDPATCIWRCYHGNNEASLATNANYQLRLASNTNRYLTSTNTNGTAISTITQGYTYNPSLKTSAI